MPSVVDHQRLGLIAYLRRRRHDASLWKPQEDAIWRERLSNANDGIISSAAIIQGLLTGGATGNEAVIGVCALITIGVVATAASEYAEAQSTRVTALRIEAEEAAALKRSPEKELGELAQIYRDKGLPDNLAQEVAVHLMSKDPLRAQLEEEFGLEEVPTRACPWRQAALAGGVFFLGSILPLVLLLVLPWDIRAEVTVLAVLLALAISGWVGHFVEHSSMWRSMVRTILVGAIILGISTLAGRLVSF